VQEIPPSAPPQEKLVLVLDALSKIEIRILALDEVNFTEVGTAAKQKLLLRSRPLFSQWFLREYLMPLKPPRLATTPPLLAVELVSNVHFTLSHKTKFSLPFRQRKRDPKTCDRPQRERLTCFETGISVIRKIKLTIMTGTGEFREAGIADAPLHPALMAVPYMRKL
jgi:hypothetical protein